MGRLQPVWIIVNMTMCFHVGNGMEILDNGENLDIRKAVNTSETLWLFEQTYLNGFYSTYERKIYFEEETCIRNDMVNISETYYYFTETMEVELEDENATTNYKGIFSSNDSKSMTVINFDARSARQLWTLQYQDPENGPCMVFIIQELQAKLSDDIGVCHMYIRGKPKGSDPPNGCKIFFSERCNSATIYKPYRDSCKDGKSSDTVEDNNIGFSNQI
uniref:Putative secreted protein n=1 Tax=Amblyomma americanum TaxID=6943 RepID=A0A0C9SFG5_AMBAM